MLTTLEVFIEFKDLAYSLIEGDRVYQVTIVKQGEPGENIVVLIIPEVETAECKRLAIQLKVSVVVFLAYKL